MQIKHQTKQVTKMVESVNQVLKENHISDGDNELFSTMNWLLLQANCYNGYNLYITDTQTGIDRLVRPEEWDNEEIRSLCFLQILK